MPARRTEPESSGNHEGVTYCAKHNVWHERLDRCELLFIEGHMGNST